METPIEDEVDTMVLPESTEDFSPIICSTLKDPEPTEGYSKIAGQFHFGFKEDTINESLPRFSID